MRPEAGKLDGHYIIAWYLLFRWGNEAQPESHGWRVSECEPKMTLTLTLSNLQSPGP